MRILRPRRVTIRVSVSCTISGRAARGVRVGVPGRLRTAVHLLRGAAERRPVEVGTRVRRRGQVLAAARLALTRQLRGGERSRLVLDAGRASEIAVDQPQLLEPARGHQNAALQAADRLVVRGDGARKGLEIGRASCRESEADAGWAE